MSSHITVTPISTDVAAHVLELYGLCAGEFTPGRGTASSHMTAQTSKGRLMIRRRRPEYSEVSVLRHDHALLWYLYDNGFPCAPPCRTVAGATWVEPEGSVYEVTQVIEGEAFDPDSYDQLRGLGRTVGLLHELTVSWRSPFEKPWLREDDPSLLLPPLDELIDRAQGDERQVLELAREVLESVAENLPETVYRALPLCIIHGDLHPGNVLFRDGRVVGFFDWDWASEQARIRDVCDGVVYFAASRATLIDGSDIWSLTQPWKLRPERAAVFMAGYREHHQLTDEELDACFWQICSRWLQGRIRGARKVEHEHKACFAARQLLEPLEELEHLWLALRRALHRKSS